MPTKEKVEKLYNYLAKAKEIMNEASSKNIDIFESKPKGIIIMDYKEQKKQYLKNMFNGTVREILLVGKELQLNLDSSISSDNKKTVDFLGELLKEEGFVFFQDKARFNSLYDSVRSLNSLFADNKDYLKNKVSKFKIPVNIPKEIRSEVVSEIEEIEKCNETGCYRAAVVLCGRLLEIALHRKYYEMTNNDLLETNPNIGLGKLIAKLKEKGIEEVPGLTQQIHLINNVRITSVHKKSTNFYPSKAQAQAIILYTIDAAEKLFEQ